MRKSLFKTRVQALYGHRPPLTTSPPPITAKQNSPLVIARTRNCFVLTRPLWWCRALGNVLAMVRTPVMSRWTSRRIILPRHRSNYPRPLYLPLNWALEPPNVFFFLELVTGAAVNKALVDRTLWFLLSPFAYYSGLLSSLVPSKAYTSCYRNYFFGTPLCHWRTSLLFWPPQYPLKLTRLSFTVSSWSCLYI